MSAGELVGAFAANPDVLLRQYDESLLLLVDGQMKAAVRAGDVVLDDPQSWVGYQVQRTAETADQLFMAMSERASEHVKASEDGFVVDLVVKEARRRQPKPKLVADLIDGAETPLASELLRATADTFIWTSSKRALRKWPVMVELELPLLDNIPKHESVLAMRAGLNAIVWSRARREARKRGRDSPFVASELQNASSPFMRDVMERALRHNEWHVRPGFNEIETR